MTTRISFRYVPDVSIDNDSLVLRTTSTPLSAGVWICKCERTLEEARLSCLAHAFSVLAPLENGWEVWTMVGHRATQPDSRIVRYMGIWKSLSRRSIRFSDNEAMEVLHEYEDGVGFVGGVRVGSSDVAATNAAMMGENAVVILVRQQESQSVISDIMTDPAALRGPRSPFGLLDSIARNHVVVLAVYGEFDDPEATVAAIGASADLEELGIGLPPKS